MYIPPDSSMGTISVTVSVTIGTAEGERSRLVTKLYCVVYTHWLLSYLIILKPTVVCNYIPCIT